MFVLYIISYNYWCLTVINKQSLSFYPQSLTNKKIHALYDNFTQWNYESRETIYIFILISGVGLQIILLSVVWEIPILTGNPIPDLKI